MSTDNVWIEVVGISGNIIEFWSAEPPDMAPTRMGLDHPATLIEILARVWSGDNALKNVIAGHDIAWIADHAGEPTPNVSMTIPRSLRARRGCLAGTTRPMGS